MLRLLLTLCSTSLALLVAFPGMAAAEDDDESVRDMKVALAVQENGDVRVTETIVYDHADDDDEDHGIFRYIPYVVDQDDGRSRRYVIDGIRVSSPTKAPVDLEVEDDDYNRSLKIGDEDIEVSGRQTYVISYVVRGGLLPYQDHDELYWDAVGDGWEVPIARASVEVTVPASLTAVACYRGEYGSRDRCASATAREGTARFGDGGLSQGEGVTVSVSWPKGAVTVSAPNYFVWPSRWELVPGWIIVGVAALILIPIAYVLTGPRRSSGPVTPILAEPGAVPAPLAAALGSTGANVNAVTASIVELAARGYLTIEQTSKKNWMFTRLRDPDGLAPYEKTLFDALFAESDQIKLSKVRKTATGEITTVKRQINRELVTRGWLRYAPGVAMGFGCAIPFVVFIAIVVVWVAYLPGSAWFCAGLLITALGVPIGALTGGPRTPLGSAIGQDAEQLKKSLRAEPAMNGDPSGTFSTLMPYAVAFGLAREFSQHFAKLDEPIEVGWWSAPTGFHAFGSFTHHAGKSMSPPASSGSGGSGSSGGFSGGGGGGGGGGGW